jgi:hypothetical protein
VKTFFTPASQKEKNEKLSWTVDGALLVAVYTPSNPADSPPTSTEPGVPKKIAAFDLVSGHLPPTTLPGKAEDAAD